MEKNGKRWLRFTNRVLSMLLALLGVAACDGSGSVEYGTPVASYHVKGKVVDAETGLPIEGMRVKAGCIYQGDGASWLTHYPEILTSDKQGAFEKRVVDLPGNTFRLIWEDVDGAVNGAYVKDSVDVKIDKFVGGQGWSKGEATVEATLKAKKVTPK
ncbi:MAG: radical SAM-associated putative lipoprotein [Bacteroides sp.]|uniref:radical SAM-associated putative lipoprotein n=1 Tax=Bacteroides sp. TaxID=29523 RepID=UPI002FCADA2B